MDGSILKPRRHRFPRYKRGLPNVRWNVTPKSLEVDNTLRLTELDTFINQVCKMYVYSLHTCLFIHLYLVLFSYYSGEMGKGRGGDIWRMSFNCPC